MPWCPELLRSGRPGDWMIRCPGISVGLAMPWFFRMLRCVGALVLGTLDAPSSGGLGVSVPGCLEAWRLRHALMVRSRGD